MAFHFDKVIMNPPYGGNLHLEILNECLSHSTEIVNLSPILRLEVPIDPINKDKRLSHIKEIESIPVELAQKLFCRNPTDLGIWHIFPNQMFEKSWNSFKLRGFKNIEECEKLYNECVNAPDNFKNHIIWKKPMKGYCVVYSHMCGLSPSHNFVYKDNIAPDGKTYREHVTNQHKNDFPRSHFSFSTYEEAEKFRQYLNSDKFKLIEKITQPGLLRILELLPYYC